MTDQNPSTNDATSGAHGGAEHRSVPLTWPWPWGEVTVDRIVMGAPRLGKTARRHLGASGAAGLDPQ